MGLVVSLTTSASASHDADEGMNSATSGVTELWGRGLDPSAADAASRTGEGQAEQDKW